MYYWFRISDGGPDVFRPGPIPQKIFLHSSPSARALFWLFAALAVITAIIHASRLAWVCDDAFISFSYARNFVRGSGLVYNPGERVEGYTNFLWTMLVAGGMYFGFDPTEFATGAGIVSAAAAVMVFVFASLKLQRELLPQSFMVPVTAIALATQREFNVFATSGLETAFFTLAVSLLFILLAFRPDRPGLAGIAATLVMLNRPDGALFVLAALFSVFLFAPRPGKALLWFLAPLAFVYVPYWFWRFAYYGYPFPNSFYAKSASTPYISQGWEYIRLYFLSYYLFLIIPAAAAVLLWKYRDSLTRLWRLRRQPVEEAGGKQRVARILTLGGLFIALQVAYVTWVGGDFMFARFLIPVTPVLFFILEILLLSLSRHAAVVALIILPLTLFRYDVFNGDLFNGYIANERDYYAETDHHLQEKIGKTIHDALDGADLRIAFIGARAAISYYLDPAYAIEGTAGLTDERLAHAPLTTRGRPGHEKPVSFEYLKEKKIHLFFDGVTEYHPGSVNTMLFFGEPARIICYDNTVMDRLAMVPNIRFRVIPGMLDTIIDRLPEMSHDEIARYYGHLKEFYFNYNNDPDREKRFLEYLQ